MFLVPKLRSQFGLLNSSGKGAAEKRTRSPVLTRISQDSPYSDGSSPDASTSLASTTFSKPAPRRSTKIFQPPPDADRRLFVNSAIRPTPSNTTRSPILEKDTR